MADATHGGATDIVAVLASIAADPDYGPGTLSNPIVLSNLLKDLLPGSTREKRIIVAAAEADLAGTLLDYAGQGMDPATVVNLAASQFAESSLFANDLCSWVAEQFALALGMTIPMRTQWPFDRGNSMNISEQPYHDEAARIIAEAELRATEIVTRAERQTAGMTDDARTIGSTAPTSSQGVRRWNAQSPIRDSRQAQSRPAQNREGAILAEIVMLRARAFDLAVAVEAAREGHSVHAAIAASLADDIARARREVGQDAVAAHLDKAEEQAKMLLRALQGNGVYRVRWPGKGYIHARPAAAALWSKLMQIPLDVSGKNLKSLDLPRILEVDEWGRHYSSNIDVLAPLRGVIWSDETVWPDGYKKQLIEGSKPIRKGTYQVSADRYS